MQLYQGEEEEEGGGKKERKKERRRTRRKESSTRVMKGRFTDYILNDSVQCYKRLIGSNDCRRTRSKDSSATNTLCRDKVLDYALELIVPAQCKLLLP